jgi:hypothetical protein
MEPQMITITKTDGTIENWDNCHVDFMPTWLGIHFNHNGITVRTFAYPMSEIKQVEIEYENSKN